MALTNQLYHTSIKIGEDAQTQIDFETADEIHFDVDGTEALRLDSSQNATFAGDILTSSGDLNITPASRVVIGGSGLRVASGTEGAPGIAWTDDPDTGFWRDTPNEIQISTGGTEALRIDSSQQVTIRRELNLGVAGIYNGIISSPESLFFNIDDDNDSTSQSFTWAHNAGGTGGTALMTLTDEGLLGIGETSPGGKLHITTGNAGSLAFDANADDLIIESNGAAGLHIFTPNTSNGRILFSDPDDADAAAILFDHANDGLDFYIAATKKLSLDGNNVIVPNNHGLVVGHTAQLTIDGLVPEVQVLGTADGVDSAAALGGFGTGIEPRLILAKARGTISSPTAAQNGDNMGEIIWVGHDGTDFTNTNLAKIHAISDGSAVADTNSAGALIFSTTANGAGTVTEALRIDRSQMVKVAAGSGTTIPTDGQYWWADINGDMHLSSQGALLVDIDTNANNSDKRFAVRTNAGTTSLFEVNEDGVSLFAGNITVSEDSKIDFSNTAPGTSGDATGVIFSFTAGATLAVGDVVYMGTGGKVLLADADAATSMPALGICTSTGTDTNPVDVMIQGIMKLTGWSFTAGDNIFVSTTAGDVTSTAPSGTGDTVQKVGVATASDTVYFNFNTTELVLA